MGPCGCQAWDQDVLASLITWKSRGGRALAGARRGTTPKLSGRERRNRGRPLWHPVRDGAGMETQASLRNPGHTCPPQAGFLCGRPVRTFWKGKIRMTLHLHIHPVYSELNRDLKIGDMQLLKHQVETLEAFHDPNIDVIFNTAMTGDGKSLAAYLPA